VLSLARATSRCKEGSSNISDPTLLKLNRFRFASMARLRGVGGFFTCRFFEFEDSVLAQLSHSAGLYMIGLGLE